MIPVRHARLAQAAMPGSRLTIFDRCGHFPFHDDPDRFIEVVERFIDSTQAAAYDQELLRHLLRTGLPQRATSGPIDAHSHKTPPNRVVNYASLADPLKLRSQASLRAQEARLRTELRTEFMAEEAIRGLLMHQDDGEGDDGQGRADLGKHAVVGGWA